MPSTPGRRANSRGLSGLRRKFALPFGLALLPVLSLVLTDTASSAPQRTKSGGQHSASSSPLATLANALASFPIDEESLIVLGPLLDSKGQASTLDAEAKERLRKSLHQSVLSTLPLQKERPLPPLSPLAARTLARQKKLPLLYVSPQLIDSKLSLSLRYSKWPRSFWARSLHPQGSLIHQSSIEVKSESLVRPTLPPAARFFEKREVLSHSVIAPLAVACGSRDQQGSRQLFIMNRQGITRGKVEGSQLVVVNKARWAQLSPVAPAPLRAPLGALNWHEGKLWAGISDRAELLSLTDDLQVLARFKRAAPLGQELCAPFTSTGLGTRFFSCSEKPPPTSRGSSLDAYARATLFAHDGRQVEVTAQLPLEGDAKITAASSDFSLSTEVKSFGDALAWADINGDGAPDLLSSSSPAKGKGDALVIHSVKDGKLVPGLRMASPPVHALSICAFEGENPLTAIALVGSDIWVLK